MGRRNFSSPQGILEEYGGPPSLPAGAGAGAILPDDRGAGLLRLGLEALRAGDRGRARDELREALALLSGEPRERALEGLVEACRRDHPAEAAEALRLERGSARSKKAKESLERRIQALDAASLTEGGTGSLALTALPVLPPAFMLPLGASGEPATAANLAPLYREIIEINTRLRDVYERAMPDVVVADLEGKLQRAVDALFDAFGGGEPPLRGP